MAADDVGVISGLYTGISSGDWIKGAIDAYIMGKIKYGLYTDGIKVQHPFKPEKTITWEQIQEICICYSFSIQRLKCGYVVIAFVKKGTKRNLWKRWETIAVSTGGSLF